MTSLQANVFKWLDFGSSGRIRTYNPSVNSRHGFSRLTLQTQLFRRAKAGFSRKWGGSGGLTQPTEPTSGPSGTTAR